MNNLATLTRSHTLIAAKKREKRRQIKEILFDEDSRRDFLTGFHKRKLAKAEAARKKAQERQKQDQSEVRRERRRALREQAIENARQVESAYASIYGQDRDNEDDEEEWTGISRDIKQRDETYEDDEILATVTVVEDFDPDTAPSLKSYKKSIPPSETLSHLRKPKSIMIRYQTKEARKAERMKQLARRTEKAERAGGKTTRRNSSKKKPKLRE